jgi:hypothetical protein
VLGQVPLGDVLPPTLAANEGSDSCMLAQVHLKVGAGVVLLVTALELALEFISILMCFFVVPQDP